MASAKESKGSKIDINTFKKWGKENVIGYRTAEENGRTYVTFAWCKVCSRNKDALFVHPNCKGSVKNALKAYVEGTNYITKHNITRHLNGEAHRIALSIEKSKPEGERLGIEQQATEASGSGVRILDT